MSPRTRRRTRLPDVSGAVTSQVASTNWNPGLTGSLRVTVLVASDVDGFHWKVTTPSSPVVCVLGPRSGGGAGWTQVYDPGLVGPRRRTPTGVDDVLAVALVDRLGDRHRRPAELRRDLAQRLGEIVEVLDQRVVGVLEIGPRERVEAGDRRSDARRSTAWSRRRRRPARTRGSPVPSPCRPAPTPGASPSRHRRSAR